MLPVFVIAVAFSVCDCAPLTAKNVSLDPQQNDRALYIKIYSSFEISQSDITLLQTQLDTLPGQANFETILLVISGNPFQNMYLRYSDSDSGRADPPAKLYMVEYVTTESADNAEFKALLANSRRIISGFMLNHGANKVRYTITTDVVFGGEE